MEISMKKKEENVGYGYIRRRGKILNMYINKNRPKSHKVVLNTKDILNKEQ